MKTNITKNLASAAMLVILSPLLALAILVSIKTAGIMENDVLLLLLTLSSAVLSGINGFGRRAAGPGLLPSVQDKAKMIHSNAGNQYSLSVRPSTNA